jgi:hypothetical protein
VDKKYNTPGIIYVKDLRADSICETALEFLMMKSPYDATHLGGRDKACAVVSEADLYNSNIVMELARAGGGKNKTKKER